MASINGKYCIDLYEASVDVVNARGATLRRQSPYHAPKDDDRIRARTRRGVVPQAHISQERAADACAAAGKRLCTDDEWAQACKGRQPTRYPYGEDHQPGRCNDKGVSPLRKLHGATNDLSVFGFEAMNDPRLNRVPGSLARTGQFSRCRNSFGLYDMVGNLHEWTANGSGVFRGGYYLDNEQNGRGCDYKTAAHSTKYRDYSTGFRCCSGGPEDARVRAARAQKAKKAKPGKLRSYTVEKGDTLWGIARKHEITVAALCEASGITEAARIVPGQELKIP